MNEPRPRAQRLEVFVGNEWIEELPSTGTFWHETERQVAERLTWGREKARLLAWVRRQMAHRLTECERAAVELHYFEGLSFRDAAERLRRNPSSVCRAVQRSIRKLRQAAAEDHIHPRPLRIPRS